MRRQRFERFYLEKVAVGEGCGCAEQALGMHEMDRRADEQARRTASASGSGRRRTWLERWLRRTERRRSGS